MVKVPVLNTHRGTVNISPEVTDIRFRGAFSGISYEVRQKMLLHPEVQRS